ncbi:ROK family protein [Phenylobacterium sp. LjRoot225]|uniref:ROK family protein n=1 Tax=Phenylobacterium sp. LjRoot225 TaxID=3342285 RepID=UPI003ECEA44A
MIQIGIDFGGTKIEAAALDASGAFLARQRSPTPDSYDAAIRAVRDLVAGVEQAVQAPGSVGVGCPGSISPSTGVMRNANSVYLNGRRFGEDLGAALGREIRLANDANCLALSEAADGAAAGAAVAFAVVAGTGCGGGLVVGGALVEGHNGIAGEWGHTPLPWPAPDESPGPRCWCGQHGCLETWVSGTGLQRDYAEQVAPGVVAEEVVTRFRAGEPGAVAAFDRYVDRLGRAIAVVCNMVDPDVIVLGGGMSNVAELYERLPQVIERRVFSDRWSARIAPAKWGDSSGVRGAARLWPSQAAPVSSTSPEGA